MSVPSTGAVPISQIPQVDPESLQEHSSQNSLPQKICKVATFFGSAFVCIELIYGTYKIVQATDFNSAHRVADLCLGFLCCIHAVGTGTVISVSYRKLTTIQVQPQTQSAT